MYPDNRSDLDSLGSVTATPRIPAYLSHSYRAEDRDINRFVHDLCWDHGLALTVDPQCGPISTTRLEMMMRRSACFVAVVTRRDDQPEYRCSPFIVFEYGLAVRAHTRRLVLLENYVSGAYFPEQHNTVTFDRTRLAASRPEIEAALDRLAAESRAYVNLANHSLGEVGLLLPETPEYQEAAPMIRRVFRQAGYSPVDLDLADLDSAGAARRLERLDLVVIDLADARQPLIAFIEGLFVPSMKLIFHRPGQTSPVELARLLVDQSLATAGTAGDVATWWSDQRGLEAELVKKVEALRTPRHEFRSKAEGGSYFRSLGLTRGPVFVSSASADNAMARDLVKRLRSYNIQPFHYIYENTIPAGADWTVMLRNKIEESAIFVPLISREYWESKHCREEFDTANQLYQAGRLRLIPCFLERTDGPQITAQGIPLDTLEPALRVDRVVSLLDLELLVDGEQRRSAGLSPAFGDQKVPQVDIAILTALSEEYDAVYQHLDNPERVAGTVHLPNRYSWVVGTVTSEGQGSYRILLALGGIGNETALLAAKNILDAFRPDTVLLVGIAGDVSGRLREGDAVVADRIVGYELGRIRGGFHPRPDLSFPTDQSLASAARTMTTRQQDWSQWVLASPPEPTERAAQVLVGPVASGNKVVDDLTDAAFAPVLAMWPKLVAVEMEAIGTVSAVEDAREHGLISHFSMIRGISDRPVSNADAARADLPTSAEQTRRRHLWRQYAAAVAAAFAVRLIQTSWPRRPRSTAIAVNLRRISAGEGLRNERRSS